METVSLSGCARFLISLSERRISDVLKFGPIYILEILLIFSTSPGHNPLTSLHLGVNGSPSNRTSILFLYIFAVKWLVTVFSTG